MVMKKKSIIMLVCALLIISSVAFGTIAYLTDRESVTNRFTVGDVEIIVDESKVDENGNAIPDADRVKENDYHIVPGGVYDKDPTMTVKAGSEESYVRMMVTVTKASQIKTIFDELATRYDKYAGGFVPNEHVEGWNSAEWTYYGMTTDATANTFTLEFRYYAAVKPLDTEDKVLPALFTKLKIPGELTNEHLKMLKGENGENGFQIEVVGHAIQTAGFRNADEAWAAFDGQMKAAGVTTPGTTTPNTPNTGTNGAENNGATDTTTTDTTNTDTTTTDTTNTDTTTTDTTTTGENA